MTTENDAWAEIAEEHWHSDNGIGPYRCRGCNGSQVVLTEAQVAAINAGAPTLIAKEQWQAVIDRGRVIPPDENALREALSRVPSCAWHGHGAYPATCWWCALNCVIPPAEKDGEAKP